MLHEILLCLSGHPSALFDQSRSHGNNNESPFPLLSPPEAALLSSIEHLANIHRNIRSHSETISSSHGSTICRAVATAIRSAHLDKFQQKILDVEQRILRKDASIVGAYNIVPLAGIVSEFDEWTRRMEWYWDILCYILPERKFGSKPTGDDSPCSGAAIIDRLRQEGQTGYPDIEEVALSLSKIAETTWLRQLSTFVLYGRIPSVGKEDFFIQIESEDTGSPPHFRSVNKLSPKFVSTQTVSSVLFIGKSLNQIRSRNGPALSGYGGGVASELALVPTHLQYLSGIEVPIISARLAESISTIRTSLSRNTLRQLLPLSKIVQALLLLQQFFLLGRGEFAVNLIAEADECIKSRHRRPSLQSTRRIAGLHDVLLKEGEVNAVLSKTWAVLSSLINEEDMMDDLLDLARELIHLTIPNSKSSRPATPGRALENEILPQIPNIVFNDLLLSVPVNLSFVVPPPLDLFLTISEVDIYSTVHSYLLGIRRSHIHLADLWKQSSLRRDHPSPMGPPQSTSAAGQKLLKQRRERARARRMAMRKVWASCGSAVFLLSEIGAYFEGEVVRESWKHLYGWLTAHDENADNPGRQTMRSDSSLRSSGIPRCQTSSERVQLDPETIATAHRKFLSALVYSLLLTDVSFARTLQLFLIHVDEYVAFIVRLQRIHQNLDLEEDDGVVDALANYAQDEQDISLELDRARKRVDSDMKSLVGRLREIDVERIGSRQFDHKGQEDFEPWKGGGVDRLLMKLDFGNMTIEEENGDGKGLVQL
ncbi:hypothetical protein M501DRAFT_935234 [Patellaria atrata CBS 101060]|uniref:Spindle pole body component n=1 Tax=Patellaria atrata CBS 101060 TaxID=1346257 RepID=A0A9P4SA81_9PEZI|nr:hypothetical protein M501DRAFT_935234 [Patellaria atrata CBS 101060]